MPHIYQQAKFHVHEWLSEPFDGEALRRSFIAVALAAIIWATAISARAKLRFNSITSANSSVSPVRSRNLRLLEYFLWALAAVSIIYCVGFYASAAAFQSHEKSRLAAMSAPTVAPRTPPPSSESAPQNAVASTDPLLGTLAIARLDILSIVEEGIDGESLALSVGHEPGSALPGQRGNMILAAHRDTYFSRLGEIEPGDEIVFRSPNREYKYLVDGTQIVDEDDTSVLEDTPGTNLTLITCYPFHYVGAAPKRFVVLGHIVTP